MTDAGSLALDEVREPTPDEPLLDGGDVVRRLTPGPHGWNVLRGFGGREAVGSGPYGADPRHRRDRRERARPPAGGRSRRRGAPRPRSPAALLEALPGVQALIIRSATTVDAGVLDAGRDLARRRPRRHRPRQRRRRRGHPSGRDGRQRAAEQRGVGRRAHDGAAAGPGPQRPAGPRRAGRRAVGAQPLGGRRAGRQDARHRRPRPDRQARRRSGPRLRHATRCPRPVRLGRPGPPARRRAAAARPGRR